MARKFNIPIFYKSSVIGTIKEFRKTHDHRKQDLTPSILDLGKVKFKIARHFGFCYGVENAIEIAYKALEENPDKRVFLLSEMIHNPNVNNDLLSRGIKFLMSTKGEQLIDFSELNPDDIVIVPAFGTTVELFEKLEKIGIDPFVYNATCPFVERVWKRAAKLGKEGYTIVIHGKHDHEETRATFSHSTLDGASIIVRDIEQAKILADYINGKNNIDNFFNDFKNLTSKDFDPKKDLEKIGVVNQTTMLASETQEITNLLKEAIIKKYSDDNLKGHFADTRDTLCYATSENQGSVKALVKSGGDLAIVVGGYNSSNTSHLVELCEEEIPTFYIKDSDEIISDSEIKHLSLKNNEVMTSINWLPKDKDLNILISAGASCPDALVDNVINKVASLFNLDDKIDSALESFK
ncbi:UNVERIFIED_CONTAM: hypothetical protein GTU68_043627 [Idotea baltica]|nr:hypothetical protein [Idotea baltica]